MFYFILGFIVGALTAQKYNIPSIEKTGFTIYEYLKNMEKNNKK